VRPPRSNRCPWGVVVGPQGIKIFRFYIKCAQCNAEISFRTDPENMDYAMESGAKRMFEVWKEQDKVCHLSREESWSMAGLCHMRGSSHHDI
jgi:uncharacterized protein YfbU (UPF0304 family)